MGWNEGYRIFEATARWTWKAVGMDLYGAMGMEPDEEET
jgi:hypothetical protein